MLFSVTILSKIHYNEIENHHFNDSENNENNLTIATNKAYFTNLLNKLEIISKFEIVIVLWVFALFLEEFIQVNYFSKFIHHNSKSSF